MNTNPCTHKKHIEGHWEDNPHYDPNDPEETFDHKFIWVESHDIGTWEDVDIHHYKCTQCGLVRRY